MARVAIVGGGLAGLAAAVRLAEAGRAVTLVEKRALLGGRATSYRPRGAEAWVDNSQHVLLRCCSALVDLYERIGVGGLIDWHDSILLQAPDGSRGAFSALPLPAPLHLAPALFTLPGLSPLDRAVMAIAFGRMLLDDRRMLALDDRTFAAWLGRWTTPTLDQGFWRLLLTSVLNADAGAASARYGLMFFLDGLMRTPDGFHLGIPQVPLSTLHHDAMLRRLGELGAEVRLRTAARVDLSGGRVRGIVAGGETLPADQVIAAVPWDRLPRVLPAGVARGLAGGAVDGLAGGTIIGVHLWYDAPQMAEPVIGLLANPDCDWIFALDGGRHLSLVVSDADGWSRLSAEAMMRRALAGARRALPDLPEPLAWSSCRERRATFVPAPGIDALRPSPATAVAGLWLAGGWTDTGWPATMESAARSGDAAAAGVLAGP